MCLNHPSQSIVSPFRARRSSVYACISRGLYGWHSRRTLLQLIFLLSLAILVFVAARPAMRTAWSGVRHVVLPTTQLCRRWMNSMRMDPSNNGSPAQRLLATTGAFSIHPSWCLLGAGVCCLKPSWYRPGRAGGRVGGPTHARNKLGSNATTGHTSNQIFLHFRHQSGAGPTARFRPLGMPELSLHVCCIWWRCVHMLPPFRSAPSPSIQPAQDQMCACPLAFVLSQSRCSHHDSKTLECQF